MLISLLCARVTPLRAAIVQTLPQAVSLILPQTADFLNSMVA
jgi:hypothetical protein